MSDHSSGGSIGFTGLLTLVFITLKLIGKITWSWWWVLSPIWLVAGAIVFCLIVVLLFRFIADIVDRIVN